MKRDDMQVRDPSHKWAPPSRKSSLVSHRDTLSPSLTMLTGCSGRMDDWRTAVAISVARLLWYGFLVIAGSVMEADIFGTPCR